MGWPFDQINDALNGERTPERDHEGYRNPPTPREDEGTPSYNEDTDRWHPEPKEDPRRRSIGGP